MDDIKLYHVSADYVNYLVPYEAHLFHNRQEKQQNLEELPERIKIMESDFWGKRALRQMMVDNYSVIYVIDGTQVIITDVLYSASDIDSRLRD